MKVLKKFLPSSRPLLAQKFSIVTRAIVEFNIYLLFWLRCLHFPSNLIAVLSSPPSPPCLLSCRPPHDCHPSSSSGRHPACHRHHHTDTPIIFLIAAVSSSPFHMAVGIHLRRHSCPFAPLSLSYSRRSSPPPTAATLSTFHPGSGPRLPRGPRRLLLSLATLPCTRRYLMSTGASSIPFDCMVFWWRLARKQRCIPPLLPLVCRLVVVSPLAALPSALFLSMHHQLSSHRRLLFLTPFLPFTSWSLASCCVNASASCPRHRRPTDTDALPLPAAQTTPPP